MSGIKIIVMDKLLLTNALKELDKEVGQPFKIVIIGGAAMIIHFGALRATRDVDVIMEGNDLNELKNASKIVAEKFDLDEDWLNDGVKGFVDALPPDFGKRLTKLDLDLKFLEVFVLGIAEQLTMKIRALREQDLEDIEVLLPQLTDDDKRRVIENMDVIGKKRPDWAQKIQYFLEEQGWKIN